jgi:hypothetical protein
LKPNSTFGYCDRVTLPRSSSTLQDRHRSTVLTDTELARLRPAGSIHPWSARGVCRFEERGVEHHGYEELYHLIGLQHSEELGDDQVGEFIVCAACLRRMIANGTVPALSPAPDADEVRR